MSLHHRLTLVFGFSQLIVWALTYYIPAVTTVAVAESFGTGPAPVLGGFSLALLVTGLASPTVCRRIDAGDGRAILMAGVAVQAAGLLLMATSGGLVQWYAGWAVVGMGMAAGLYDAAFATTGRLLGAAARPTITAITMIGGFASTLGWPLGAALIPAIGWRTTLVLYAAALLAINLPLYWSLPRTVPALAPPVPRAEGSVQRGRFAFLCIGAFFTTRALIGTVITVSAPVLLQGLGLSLAAAIGLVSLIGPAQVGIRVLQATLGRALSPLAVAWVGAVLLPLVTLPLAAAAGTPLLHAAALAFVLGYGLSNGILTIARGTLPLYLFGPEGYATRIGQLALPVILAQAAAPLASAPLIAGWPAKLVFLALGLVAVAAAVCLAPLTRPDRART